MSVILLQIVTVLANMAAVEQCWSELVDNGGVALLVDLLGTCPPNYPTEAELSASERVLQKTAIALTRLSRNSNTAQEVVSLKGSL